MKTFVIRTVAIVMAAILFIGAVYTCGIAVYMRILSNRVEAAEAYAVYGNSQDREYANDVYESVMEARDELYYGGGYKSWFSTQSKVCQICCLLDSLLVIGLELFFVYIFYRNYKEEQEQKRRYYERQRAY